MRINTNMLALAAQRNLEQSRGILSKTLERLASGIRVNSARDDAAGLAIASRMTGQIRGANQAARNANDGISLAQTAEGGLSNVSDALQRIRELALQSANGTPTASDRAALQAEASQLVALIHGVAAGTQFNGMPLLNGNFSATRFQVGANRGQSIAFSQTGVMPSQLGYYGRKTVNNVSYSLDSDVDSGNSPMRPANAGRNAGESTGRLSGGVILSNQNGTFTVNVATGFSVKALADRINAISARTGITAKAKTLASMRIPTGDTFARGEAFSISFTLRGSGSASFSATLHNFGDITALVDAINARAADTGITAVGGVDWNRSVIALSSETGEDISIADVETDDAYWGHVFIKGWDPLGDPGTPEPDLSRSQGGTILQVSTKLFSWGRSRDQFTDSTTVGGRLSLFSDHPFHARPTPGRVNPAGDRPTFVFNPAHSEERAALPADSTVVEYPPKLLSGINISTVEGANSAIRVVDSAMTQVSAARARLGALQSRFEIAVQNQQIAGENLTAARSRILDADYAAESTSWSRAKILQQAGAAVLAHANVVPNDVVALLKNAPIPYQQQGVARL